MPRRISKAEEARRVQQLHDLLAQHGPVKTDLRYWLIHALHWHAAIFAAVAVSLVVLHAMSGNTVDASVINPIP